MNLITQQLLFCFLFAPFYAIGMEHSIAQEKPHSINTDQDTAIACYNSTLTATTLLMPELRLPIIEYLFELADKNKPLKDFQALSLANTESLAFFKNSKKFTEFLAKFLYKKSYFTDFKLSHLDTLRPLLHEEGITTFNTNLTLCDALVSLIKECSKNNEWEKVYKELVKVKKLSSSNYMSSYYYNGIYKGCPAKKNLLVQALECNAPEDIIKFLIDCKFPPNTHITTPGHMLLLYDQVLEQDTIFASSDSDSNQKQKASDTRNRLEKIITMVIDAGASPNSLFCSYNFIKGKIEETPLLLAIEKGNLQRILFLIKKEVCLVINKEFEVLIQSTLFKNEEILTIICSLLNKDTYKNRTLDIINLLVDFEQVCSFDQDYKNKLEAVDINWKERSRSLLLMLLEKNTIDIHTPCAFEQTVIARAQAAKNDEFAQILILHGAVSTSLDEKWENTMLLMKKLKKNAMMCGSLEENNLLTLQTNSRALLDEVRKLLLDNKITLNKEIIFLLLGIAIDNSLSNEARDFLKIVVSREPLSLNITLEGNTTPITSVSDCFQVFFYGMKNLDLSTYKALLNQSIPLIAWLGKEGLLQSIEKEGKTAAEKAEELGMPELAELIILALQGKLENELSVFMQRLTNLISKSGLLTREEQSKEARAVLDEARKLLVDNKITNQAIILHLFAYIIDHSSSVEAKEFLKVIVSKEPLLIELALEDYKTAPSIFHCLVAYLYMMKNSNPAVYEPFLRVLSPLISWLAQEGIEDKYLSEGKRAVEKAHELDMPELAEQITYALMHKGENELSVFMQRLTNLLYNVGPLTQEEQSQEARAVLDKARKLLVDNKILHQGLLFQLFGIIIDHSSSVEARKLLQAIASKEPLLIEMTLEDYKIATSVFHCLVAYLYIVKNSNPSVYEPFLRVLSPLISWLAQEGIEDKQLSKGKRAVEKAHELGMPELAQMIAHALAAKSDDSLLNLIMQ